MNLGFKRKATLQKGKRQKVMNNIYTFLLKGGPIVVAIGICSVIALGIFLERFWRLQRNRVINLSFVERIRNLVKEKRLSDARLLCEENNTAMSRIFHSVLVNATKNRTSIKEVVEESGRSESIKLERYVEVIGTIAMITPLLGLLGTVLGMIRVFQRIEEYGLGDPGVFASGIWEALITTAVGLCVAIPSLIFHRYLQGHIEQLVAEMEEESLNMIKIVAQD